MLPQKFSAATTCTTSGALVEAPAQAARPRAARKTTTTASVAGTRFDLITVTVIISDRRRKGPLRWIGQSHSAAEEQGVVGAPAQVVAAVDTQGLAGDERRLGTDEIAHGGRDVLDRPDTAE